MSEGSDDDIERLLDRARNGDDEARNRLIEHAHGRLLKLTRKMLAGYPSVKRWEQTDDVFVNAMMRLHRALQSVQPTSARHFFNLAGSHIRWELIDLKKRYYGPLGLGKNHHTDHQAPDAPGGSFAEAAREAEDLADWGDFHEEVEKLPEELREVFNLLYYEGLTQQQAAQVVGVAVSTVKRRWQEARLWLHDRLGGTS